MVLKPQKLVKLLDVGGEAKTRADSLSHLLAGYRGTGSGRQRDSVTVK